jgi:hypothetical protein
MTAKELRLREAAKAFMKVMREELATATTEEDMSNLFECHDKVSDALSKWNDEAWVKSESIGEGDGEEPYC